MRANAGCSCRNGGFTLIELMIAVVILAIIAAVALPLYTQYSMRTYRAELQADLMTCAQGLERFSAQNFNYQGAVLADLCDPMSVRQGRYAIALVVPLADPTRFTLTATPADPGPMTGDGILTYDDAGRRAWDRDNNGAIAPEELTWQD